MASALVSRVPYLAAAALVAAATADPIVESVANTGVFGSHYADNNHLGVLPTLLLGALMVLAVAGLRCSRVWRQAIGGDRDRLVNAAFAFSERPPARDLPYVLGLQLMALFALESAERLFAGDTVAGGTAWLGGPLAFSVLVHGAVGIGCTLLLGAFMRSIVRTFRSFLVAALHWMWLALARATAGGIPARFAATAILRAQSPHVRSKGGRAPPLLPIPA